jgi:hypothetical protein
VIRNLHVENVDFRGNAVGSRICGLERSPIENVVIRNITVSAQIPGRVFLHAQHVRNLAMENVRLEGAAIDEFLRAEHGDNLTIKNVAATSLTSAAPAIRVDHVKRAALDGIEVNGADTLVSVGGAAVKEIDLRSWPRNAVKCPLIGDPDVPAEALKPRADRVATLGLSVPKAIRCGETFSTGVDLRNDGEAGLHLVQVFLGDACIGRRWVWLNAGAAATVDVSCPPVYRTGDADVRVDAVCQTVSFVETPADIRLGDWCEVEVPAAERETASFDVSLANLGGAVGQRTVELRLDGRVAGSKSLTLRPGERAQLRLECLVPDAGPHRWQVGDLPEWPYATFANVQHKFFVGRGGVRIEAGGRYGQPGDMAAVFFPRVSGDFDATVLCKSQTEWTGENSAIGMILRNDLSKPDSGGLVQHIRIPKYGGYKIWRADRDGDGEPETRFDTGRAEFPLWLKCSRRGKTIETFTSADGQSWQSGGKVEVSSADAVQDVGIYANAWSGDDGAAVAEFGPFTLSHPLP